MKLDSNTFTKQFESFIVTIIILALIVYVHTLYLTHTPNSIIFHADQLGFFSPFATYSLTLAAIVVTMQIATFVHYQSTLKWALGEYSTKVESLLPSKDIEAIGEELRPINASLEKARLGSLVLSIIFSVVTLNFAVAPFSLALAKNGTQEYESILAQVDWVFSLFNLIIFVVLSALSTRLTPITDRYRQDIKIVDQTIETLRQRYKFTELFSDLSKRPPTELFSQTTRINKHFSNKLSTFTSQLSEAQKSKWPFSYLALFFFFILLNLIFIFLSLTNGWVENDLTFGGLLINLTLFSLAPVVCFRATLMIYKSMRGLFENFSSASELPILGVSLLLIPILANSLIMHDMDKPQWLLFSMFNVVFPLLFAAISAYLSHKDWKIMREELRSDHTNFTQSK